MAVPAHPRASAGVDAPQRPQVAGARRVGRLRRRHGPRRGQGAARRTARPRHRCRTRCTATAGRSATPSSGTTAASCTGRRRTTPTRRGRCCARPCWATSRSSIAAAEQCTPSLTAAGHCGNLIPTDENHVLVSRDRRNGVAHGGGPHLGRLLPGQPSDGRPVPVLRGTSQQVPGQPRGPLRRHDGDRLAGGRRRLQRRRDVLVVHLGDRPVSRLPGSARGRRRHRADREAPRRDSVQRPAADAGPADAHQPPRTADAADHPQAPQGERGRDVGARRRHPRRVPGARRGRVHQGLRRPLHAAGHRRPARRARGGSRRSPRAARPRHPRQRGRQRRQDNEQDPAGVPLRGVRDLRRGPPARAA